MQSWTAAFTKSSQLFILVAESRFGEVLAIVPLYREISQRDGRVLRLLGANASEDFPVEILMDHEFRDEAAQSIAEWLTSMVDDPVNGWDSIWLENCQADDANLRSLVELLVVFGVSEGSSTNEGSRWQSRLPGTPRELGNEMPTAVKDGLASLDCSFYVGGGLAEEASVSLGALEETLKSLISLHQLQHYYQGKVGRFTGGQFTQFLLSAARAMFADGRATIQQLSYEGRAIANSLQIMHRQSAIVLATGVDLTIHHVPLKQCLAFATAESMMSIGCRNIQSSRDTDGYRDVFGGRAVQLRSHRLAAPTPLHSMFHQVAELRGPALTSRAASRRRNSLVR